MPKPLLEAPIKQVLIVDDDGVPVPLTTSFQEYDQIDYTYDTLGHIETITKLLAGVTLETTTYHWGTAAGTSVILSETIT